MLGIVDTLVFSEGISKNNALGAIALETTPRSVQLNPEQRSWVEESRHIEPREMCHVSDLQKHFGIDSAWMVSVIQCTSIRTSSISIGGCS